MTVRSMAIVVLTVGVAVLGFACEDSITAASTVASISVTGLGPAVGSTAQFAATATLTDRTTQDITGQATWRSEDPSVAIVAATGMVTGVSTGEAFVQATYRTITGSHLIVVSNSPATITVDSSGR